MATTLTPGRTAGFIDHAKDSEIPGMGGCGGPPCPRASLRVLHRDGRDVGRDCDRGDLPIAAFSGAVTS